MGGGGGSAQRERMDLFLISLFSSPLRWIMAWEKKARTFLKVSIRGWVKIASVNPDVNYNLMTIIMKTMMMMMMMM